MIDFKKLINRDKKISAIENPYVKGAEGRNEWNDRYGNMQQAVRNWQKAFFCSIGISIVFALIIAYLASRSHIQPFVVETNKGEPYAIKSMDSWSINDNRLINFAINQFIINTRTILKDNHAQKSLLNKAYAYSANNTLNYLREYYEQNDPRIISNEYTITVHIINSLPIGKDTWQVTWDETKRSTNGGAILDVSRWMGNLNYKFGDVNKEFITDNPFGFYITQVSWSKSNQS